MFLSVQSFGAICKTKCSLQNNQMSNTQKSDEKHQSCHSESKETENSESDKCGNICKADDLFKNDSKLWDIEPPTQFTDKLWSNYKTIIEIERDLTFNISSHDPPRINFYFGVPIFIQKSSYLI